jgi:glutaredoxin 2
MTLTLYHYAHCPFCVRVRMTLGYLNLPYKSRLLSYDDESTPVKLMGLKMLPILEHDTGIMNESSDIMEFLDKQNFLRISELKETSEFKDFEQTLNLLGNPIHSLAMPYWIYTPEFNETSRAYFQKKKELKRGPFKDLMRRRHEFILQLTPLLKQIEDQLDPYYHSKKLGLYDILLAAHLWGLYVVPEFQFSEKIHQYLQQVKSDCNFDYHQDFWS